MADATRVAIVLGAMAGAIVTAAFAILFALYATPVLLASSRTAALAIAGFLVVLNVSLRWKKAREKRLAEAK